MRRERDIVDTIIRWLWVMVAVVSGVLALEIYLGNVSVWQCQTDMECEREYGHDMYGN